MAISEDVVREQLGQVVDPELMVVNIVELGLVYAIGLKDREDGKTDVVIEMTMTSPMCPAGPQLVADCKRVVGQLEGAGDVEVKVVMDPPWTPEKMNDDARDKLNIF